MCACKGLRNSGALFNLYTPPPASARFMRPPEPPGAPAAVSRLPGAYRALQPQPLLKNVFEVSSVLALLQPQPFPVQLLQQRLQQRLQPHPPTTPTASIHKKLQQAMREPPFLFRGLIHISSICRARRVRKRRIPPEVCAARPNSQRTGTVLPAVHGARDESAQTAPDRPARDGAPA